MDWRLGVLCAAFWLATAVGAGVVYGMWAHHAAQHAAYEQFMREVAAILQQQAARAVP